MRPVAAFAAVALVCALASPAARQDPQQPRPVFRAGVDAVQLEVTVLDADRHPVHELTAKDFTVLEDGKPQQIIRVEETVLGNDDWPEPVWARAARSDIESNSIENQRLIAIVMDDVHCCNEPNAASRGSIASDRWAIANAIKTAFQLIEGLGAHDKAAVLLTHDPVQLGRFTNDREALRDAVRRFEPLTEGGCVDRYRQPFGPLLANLMAAAPAKLKAIVTIGSPVPINDRDIPPCPIPTYRIADTGVTVVGRVPPVAGREQEDPTASPIPRYFLNVSGLLVDPLGRRTGMRQGPNDTGGLNVIDTNDLTAGVADILDANDSYYAVGFRTTRPTVDCKFRRVEVKVNRPGLDVRSRHMYQRPCPEPASGKPKPPRELVPFSPIVAGLLPSFDITLQATAAPFAVPGRPGAALAITVDISHPMPETRKPVVEDLDLRMVAYASGDARKDEHSRVQLTFGPDAPSRVATVMHSRLGVEPGRYELWLTVRDPQTNRIGSVFYDVEVPDFAQRALSLSGIALGSDPAPGFSAPAAFADLLPIVPEVSRELGRPQEVSAFFRVYQGGDAPLAPVTLLVKIVTGEGVVAVEHRDALAPDRFGPLRAADYRWRLPLTDLSPGPHLLSVEARIGGHIAQARDVPFIVR